MQNLTCGIVYMLNVPPNLTRMYAYTNNENGTLTKTTDRDG